MAIKTIIDLNVQADNLLPDNNQQLISPADIRNSLKDLNDSAVNRLTDKPLFGLKVYNSARAYETGEGCFYGGVIYEAINPTTGIFNSSDWVPRSSSNGTWGVIAGDIADQADLQAALALKQGLLTANNPLSVAGNILSIQKADSAQDGYLSSLDWTSFSQKQDPVLVTAPLQKVTNTLSIDYVSDTQPGILSSQNWIDITTNLIPISHSDLLDALGNAELKPGKYYKILTTTRVNEGTGTTGSIILQALELSQVATQGYLETRLPKYEEIGSGIVGIWTTSALPALDDLFIYNGKIFKNITGTNLSSPPDLDIANWELVDLSDSNYKTEVDLIGYDLIYDWISYREDKRGNSVRYSRLNANPINGIDLFQWGNNEVYGNTIDNGILDIINSILPSSSINLTKAGIYQSLATNPNRTYTFRDLDGTVAFLSDLAGSVGLIELSYSGLTTLITTSTLEAGKYYAINDFATVHVIPETTVVNTGATEKLICFATSINTIDKRVYSVSYPEDIIHYEIFDDFAEDALTPRKGKITYRKDTINNLETWYDFRAVKFRRWLVDGSGIASWTSSTVYTRGQIVYTSNAVYKALFSHTSTSNFSNDFSGSNFWTQLFTTPTLYLFWKTSVIDFGNAIAANAANFIDVLTFAGGCQNIRIEQSYSQIYNNVVYLGAGNGDSFGINCRDMTFYNSTVQNTVGKGSHGIIMSDGAQYNKVGEDCSGVLIAQGSSYNELKKFVKQTILVSGCSYNTFEAGSENNFLYFSSEANKIYREAQYNYISGSARDNIIGCKSIGNILNNSASGNVLGNASNGSIGCNNNKFTNGAYSNTIGDGSGSNLFTNGSFSNTLGYQCNGNSFTNSSSFNTIGNGSGNNSFITASSNTIGVSSSNNTFGTNANGNSIGNKSDFNAFGNNSLGNRVGNYCTSNQILPSSVYYTSVSGQYNVFENYCSNNMINGNFNRLDSYCNFIQCTSQVYMSNCFFCSGTQSISFSGQFIMDNLRVLLSRDFSSVITIDATTALNYKNAVVDMKDSQGVLWYKTISLTGRISTKKFI